MLTVAAVNFCTELLREAERHVTKMGKEPIKKSGRKAMKGYVKKQLNTSLCRQDLTDSVKEGLLNLTDSTHQALHHVCNEECEEIVNEIRHKSGDIAFSGSYRKGSYSDICSIMVVQKVESHLLGCCGDSCGWNGETWASDGQFCNIV